MGTDRNQRNENDESGTVALPEGFGPGAYHSPYTQSRGEYLGFGRDFGAGDLAAPLAGVDVAAADDRVSRER